MIGNYWIPLISSVGLLSMVDGGLSFLLPFLPNTLSNCRRSSRLDNFSSHRKPGKLRKQRRKKPPPPPPPPPNLKLGGSGDQDDDTLRDVKSIEFDNSPKKIISPKKSSPLRLFF